MTARASDRAESGFLDRMGRASRVRVQDARARESESALLARALETAPPPTLDLKAFDIIAELKLRSPASGLLAEQAFDRDGQIRTYAAGGAAAVSVLTEPDEFNGSMDDLRAAATALESRGIPAMRKDFLTDPYQILEARAAGAGGVLLIVTMLSDPVIEELLRCAAECSLFVLLEGFDERDLERMTRFDTTTHSPAAPVLCGVNCRDLRSLEVDFDRFRKLAACLPPGLAAVAESGISGPAEIARVAQLGYSAALVGSALMRAADPARLVGELRDAGANASGAPSCS